MPLLEEIIARLTVHKDRFLVPEYSDYDLGTALNEARNSDKLACINARTIIEYILRAWWRHLGISGSPASKTTEMMMSVLAKKLEEGQTQMPRRINDKIRRIQMTGNRAAHLSSDQINHDDAVDATKDLADVLDWHFGPKGLPVENKSQEKKRTQDLASPADGPAPASLKIAILYKRNKQPDEAVLNWLEGQFRAAGHLVFIDRNLEIGEIWAKEIQDQIRRSDVVIPLLSNSSVQSEMISYEVRVAHEAAQTQQGKPRLLPIRIQFEGALPDELAGILDARQYFLWKSPQDNVPLLEQLLRVCAQPEPKTASPLSKLENEGGAVPLDSHFYVVRPVDAPFLEAVKRKDGILLLHGARQIGKTSLLCRGLKEAKDLGFKEVVTDFQTLNDVDLSTLKNFYQALCTKMALKLDLEVFPQEVWREQLSDNDNFMRFMEKQVLAKATTPIFWAMDEVDRLFTCSYVNEVFGLFRSRFNSRALEPSGPWSKLTMVFVYATEAHLFITDMNQSPFNVGTKFELTDFSLVQIADLNVRYGSPLGTKDAVGKFHHLMAGQPYLTRRGLREMVDSKSNIDALERVADREDGPFGDHLRRILVSISERQEHLDLIRVVLKGTRCTDQKAFYRLRTAGILSGDIMGEARLRCPLYARYLERHLL